MFLLNADFINLLDNYEMSTGVSETVTSEELQENRLFIDAIVETELMKVQQMYKICFTAEYLLNT